VLENQFYQVSAQATRWCQALGSRGEVMGNLMKRYPDIAYNAMRNLAKRLQELLDRYCDLATERVERRVARALIRLAGRAPPIATHGGHAHYFAATCQSARRRRV
jgi:CRP-like cAMP-binding protein